MKAVLVLVSLSLLGFASSCSSTGNSGESLVQSNEDQSSTSSTNIVRVLNRVECHEERKGSCPQDYINAIWQTCVNNGFQTGTPSSDVYSSRNIKELVNKKEEISRSRPAQLTDENGIVSSSETHTENYQVAVDVKGYCVGSEYIVKRPNM